MKVTIINVYNSLATHVAGYLPEDIISSKTNESLKINAKYIVDKVNTQDLVIIYLNKETFNITSILSLLALSKKDVSKLCLIINTSDLTKEEEVLFDDIIEEVTDFISCIITDTYDDLDKIMVNYINNYRSTYNV